MADNTRCRSMPTLRHALGNFEEPEFDRGPVFNVKRRVICGIVVRGGTNLDVCAVLYVACSTLRICRPPFVMVGQSLLSETDHQTLEGTENV